MDWFRMYSEFASDPKVQSMSEAMQRRLMMVLCLRCSNTLVTLHDDEIAFALRISESDLAESKALFVRKGFIDDAWEVMNWDKRQFVSDSSAHRVAKHRAAKKEAKKTTSAPADEVCNVTVTPQNRTDTEQIQNRTEDINPTVEDKPSTDRRAPPKRDDSLAVFEHWQGVMGHKSAKLDAKRVKAIKARLKDGYTVADLCHAVDGCKLSPHHQGKNDAGTIYDDIELICRDGPHVDKFRKIAEHGPPSAPKKSFAEQLNERVNRGTGQQIIDIN